MATALGTANYLIKLAATEEESEFLTPLRLQKILYYIQAWSLALRHKPFFSDRIEAWANGPVVPRVYHAFSGSGALAIDPAKVNEPKNITQEEMTFIASVWQAYKGYSAISLRDMTHREDPWTDARRGLSPVERSSSEITHDAMLAYFSKRTKRK